MQINFKFIDDGSTDFNECLKIIEKLNKSNGENNVLERTKVINICIFDKEKPIGLTQLKLIENDYKFNEIYLKKKYLNKNIELNLLKFCESYAKKVYINNIIHETNNTIAKYFIEAGYKLEQKKTNQTKKIKVIKTLL